jgi:23S rRNA (guanosine2251-2'-O)-methyltransferase
MKKPELILLAHNIRSAYNVGSFFRTADGAGVSKIVLSGYSARPPHPGVTKTALGAEDAVPWETITQPGSWLKRMRRAGYHLVALEQSSKSKSIFTWKPKWPMVLIVGNEVRGVSPALQKLCDVVVHIPMRGQKESLNVASAMAVAVYSLI